MQKPILKPTNNCFSSGPCAKFSGWNLDLLKNTPVGRSHRSNIGKNKLEEVIVKSKKILGLPDDYLLGIVPASDTGAVEMAMWNMLGQRGVDIFAWESFGGDWVIDARDELKLSDLRIMQADYGKLPDLSLADPKRDIIFTYNGTTSGVKVPNLDWISDDREGIVICDATSAVFAMDIDWKKLDVVTYSWQKVLGGEGAHGIIILSPKAVKRLESYRPDRAIPKIFRLTSKGKLSKAIFEGSTINTPSMLANEDCLVALNWLESNGGLEYSVKKSNNNLAVIKKWVQNSNWIGFLAEDEKTISNTSICLKITDSWYLSLDKETQAKVAKDIEKILSEEKVGYDIGSYRDAPVGFRIWGGATVEASDIEILLSWLDFAFLSIKANSNKREIA